MTKHTRAPITATQEAELARFARLYGKRWKAHLRGFFWERGIPVAGLPSLYDLRNTHGPSWPVRYKLPAEAVKAEARK